MERRQFIMQAGSLAGALMTDGAERFGSSNQQQDINLSPTQKRVIEEWRKLISSQGV